MIDIGRLKQMLRELYSEYNYPPANRGMSYVFSLLFRQPQKELAGRIMGDMQAYVDHLASSVELSEFFVNDKYNEDLKTYFKIVLRDLFQLGKEASYLERLKVDEALFHSENIKDFIKYQTGKCIDYASVALFELLKNEDIRPVSYLWLVSKESRSIGHGIVVIGIDDLRFLETEHCIIFDFWNGEVTRGHEYDFSGYLPPLWPFSKKDVREDGERLYAELTALITPQVKEESRRAALVVDAVINEHFLNSFFKIIEKRKLKEPVIKFEYERFCREAATDLAHLEPDDLADKNRAKKISFLEVDGQLKTDTLSAELPSAKKSQDESENIVTGLIDSIKINSSPKINMKKNAEPRGAMGLKKGFFSQPEKRKEQKESGALRTVESAIQSIPSMNQF